MPRHHEIDILRFMAFLLVAISHACGPALWDIPIIAYMGKYGVELMLLISAFFMGKANEDSALQYIAKRAWRLLPSYYIYLIVFALVALISGHNFFYNTSFNWKSLICFNLYDTEANYPFGYAILWTISVEIQLIVTTAALKKYIKQKPITSLLLSYILFALLWVYFEEYNLNSYAFSWRYLPVWIIGLTYPKLDSKAKWSLIALWILVALTLVFNYNEGQWIIWRFGSWTLIFALIYENWDGKANKLSDMGMEVYSMYYMHGLTFTALLYLYPTLTGWLQILSPAVALLLNIAIGRAWYKFVEKPLSKRLIH